MEKSGLEQNKSSGISLTKDCYLMKLDSHTNATLVDRSKLDFSKIKG
jgi:hypothetical protein